MEDAATSDDGLGESGETVGVLVPSAWYVTKGPGRDTDIQIDCVEGGGSVGSEVTCRRGLLRVSL